MDVMLSSRKKQRLLSGETEMYELQYVRSSSGKIFYSDFGFIQFNGFSGVGLIRYKILLSIK